MLKPYHLKILQEALEGEVSPHALKAIGEANIGLDALSGQIGHDEYHFDSNAFEESNAYIAENHAQLHAALKSKLVEDAWAAFGKLSHTAQDFYAHSNYISLWLAQFDEENLPPVSEIIHDDLAIIQSPKLQSGKLYYPLEIFYFVPGLKKFILPRLPKDSHAWMNLDSPEQGVLFDYAFAAAVKVTRDEWKKALADLSEEEIKDFKSL